MLITRSEGDQQNNGGGGGEKMREKRFQIQENQIHSGEGFTPQKETDANVNPAKGHS